MVQLKLSQNKVITAIALVLILLSGALYADKFYKAPQAPANIIQTIKGPVILYETAEPHDLITAPNLGTIYYLNDEGQRIVFPDEQTFLSWYPSFESVKTIPRELLESFPLSGRNVNIRPGTQLVTIESSPQVWMIGYPNKLYWLAGGEDQVVEMFGASWMNKLVDLPEYYFANYQESTDLRGTDIYPEGLLIYVSNTKKYYVVESNGWRLVTEKGMEENHLQTKFAVEIPKAIGAPLLKPDLDSYEPKWGSPDLHEQLNVPDEPKPIDIGGAQPESA